MGGCAARNSDQCVSVNVGCREGRKAAVTRGKLPILYVKEWGVRALVDTGSDSTIVAVDSYKQIAGNGDIEPCKCTVRTMSGVKPLVGELSVDFTPLVGKKVIEVVHVAELPSGKYEMILGSDLMTRAGGKISTDVRKWKIRLGNKRYEVDNGLKRSKHVEVSAMARENGVVQIKNEITEAYRPVFYSEGEKLPATGRVRHSIELIDEKPVWVPPRRYPEAQKEIISREIKEMLEGDIIRQSKSPFSSPLWVVPKAPGPNGEERYRVVVDYRALNKRTKPDRYPLPHFGDMVDRMWGAKIFSTLDLKSGYHQILMDPRDAEKTAFTFKRGHYEFIRMPFGLSNAPATFQRLMDEFLVGLSEDYVQVYMDDIIVFSEDVHVHREHLLELLDRLREFNLRVSLDKTRLFCKEVRFMGHILSEEGVRTDPEKIQAIQTIPVPQNVKELRSFLGLANYYRKFIANYADIAESLTALTKKGVKYVIDGKARGSFERLKEALSNAPVLMFPNFHEGFTLTTDASQLAAGAVLSQGTPEGERPVAYASRKFIPAETRYSAIERELLAIVWGVEHFRPYLWGRKFTVRTDHKPLLWVDKLKESSARVTRLKEKLAPYEFRLIHTKGTQNVVADFLSRNVNTMEANGGDREETEVPPAGITTERSTARSLRVLDVKNEIVNNKLWQLIVGVIPGREILTSLHRYKKQRVVTVKIGEEVAEPEIISTFDRIVGKDKVHYLYFESDLFKTVITREYGNGNIAPESIIIECKKRVETIENEVEQEEIILAHHLGKSNHRGVNETLMYLKRSYYWQDMLTKIREVLSGCEVCARAKYVRVPREAPQMLTPVVSQPLERVQVDIFQWEGSRYLTMIDEATRVAYAAKIKNKAAQTIKAVLLGMFGVFGCPKLLIMDQGKEFKNAIIGKLLDEFQIEVHYTTPGHPRSHALIERLHGTLTEHLQLHKIGKQITGEEAMSRSILAYNSSVHSATNRVPHEDLLGIFGGKRIDTKSIADERLRSQCRQMEVKDKRVKKINNRKHVDRDYTYNVKKGDLVFRKNFCKRLKGDERYKGPFVVDECLPRNRIVIVEAGRPGAKRLITHLNEIRIVKSVNNVIS